MIRSMICCLAIVCWVCLSVVARADEQWQGPASGPPLQTAKTIIFIASDYRNGGVTEVFRSLQRATRLVGWSIKVIDGRGERQGIEQAAQQALAESPDAVVVGGFDPDMLGATLEGFNAKATPLVGWHAGALPGPLGPLFTNVTSDPLTVADTAADMVVADGLSGVVIFTDSSFAIARAKTERMAQRLQACDTCRVLRVVDIPIAKANQEIPFYVEQLSRQFSTRWTHSLAINDVYFDAMDAPLHNLMRGGVRNISAGDGSLKAYKRIRGGRSFQVATVAEPLGEQGWQLLDELNRALAGQPPSCYVTQPILISNAGLQGHIDLNTDSEIDSRYQQGYLRLWGIE